ncbi:MAG TPA: enoyl-CoA hydratase/isomerase family protein [Myxococcota bacterium]|nr:enoyl-CoA hydratase/isomerase family protein [Myxococcota bacterium]
MPYEFIRFEAPREHVALVTLHRPERLNALHGPLLDELADAVERIARDGALRVWILTGTPRPDGRPCFAAGVDLRCFAEGKGPTIEQGLRLTRRIDELLVPSIAAIDGVCTTGAAELVLACDFRVVGAAARISDWHLRHLGTGLGAWGGSTRWARLLGTARAKELILTGRELDAEDAVRWGFASSAHPSDALLEGALAMAGRIAAMKPEGVRMTLAHLDGAADLGRDASIRRAGLLPSWLGVDITVDGKDREILA